MHMAASIYHKTPDYITNSRHVAPLSCAYCLSVSSCLRCLDTNKRIRRKLKAFFLNFVLTDVVVNALSSIELHQT